MTELKRYLIQQVFAASSIDGEKVEIPMIQDKKIYSILKKNINDYLVNNGSDPTNLVLSYFIIYTKTSKLHFSDEVIKSGFAMSIAINKKFMPCFSVMLIDLSTFEPYK